MNKPEARAESCLKDLAITGTGCPDSIVFLSRLIVRSQGCAASEEIRRVAPPKLPVTPEFLKYSKQTRLATWETPTPIAGGRTPRTPTGDSRKYVATG
ncbi:hypothetical protein MRX96_025390 [Rhipicephalus microplus]